MKDKTNEKTTLNIVIDNVTLPQAEAIKDIFAMWMFLGSAGSSRWTSFFADGDGNFHPKITVNGEKPQPTEYGDAKKRWCGDEYRIDFDEIAWAMHGE